MQTLNDCAQSTDQFELWEPLRPSQYLLLRRFRCRVPGGLRAVVQDCGQRDSVPTLRLTLQPCTYVIRRRTHRHAERACEDVAERLTPC